MPPKTLDHLNVLKFFDWKHQVLSTIDLFEMASKTPIKWSTEQCSNLVPAQK